LCASCLVLRSLVSLLGEQACDLLGSFGGNQPINQGGDIQSHGVPCSGLLWGTCLGGVVLQGYQPRAK
jgi:hypothetical protein